MGELNDAGGPTLPLGQLLRPACVRRSDIVSQYWVLSQGSWIVGHKIGRKLVRKLFIFARFIMK
jgi:hypothetical protein